MRNYESDVIQFTGTHYDFGYQQGQLLKKSPILSNREKQWVTKRKYHFVVKEKEAIQLFKQFFPQMIDELQGLADALEWSLTRALQEFGGLYAEYERSGCSIVTGDNYMVRNYDADPAYYEGRYMIYKPTDGGYATIGPSMQITGRTDGMNEKGLAMGYNFINRRGLAEGFLCNMIGRMILETCANVEEALHLLKEIPHRMSFSYVLIDPSGASYVVEASPRKVAFRQAEMCTNHFELLLDENRYRMEDSVRRHEKLVAHKKKTRDAYETYQFLNDAKGGVFAHKYDASAGTIHTNAYLPIERKALFAIGSNQLPVVFDFGRYIQGEQIHITKMKGMLAYHLPFVNMEKI